MKISLTLLLVISSISHLLSQDLKTDTLYQENGSFMITKFQNNIVVEQSHYEADGAYTISKFRDGSEIAFEQWTYDKNGDHSVTKREGEKVIEESNYVNNIRSYHLILSNGIYTQTMFFSDGGVESEEQLKSVLIDEEWEELLPINYFISYFEDGDTSRYMHYKSEPDLEMYEYEGEIFPLKEIRFNRYDNNKLRSREELVNNPSLDLYEEKSGWQSYYNEQGALTQSSLFEIPKHENLITFLEQEGDGTILEVVSREYLDGIRMSENGYNSDGTYYSTYYSSGQIKSKCITTWDFFFQDSGMGCEKLEFYTKNGEQYYQQQIDINGNILSGSFTCNSCEYETSARYTSKGAIKNDLKYGKWVSFEVVDGYLIGRTINNYNKKGILHGIQSNEQKFKNKAFKTTSSKYKKGILIYEYKYSKTYDEHGRLLKHDSLDYSFEYSYSEIKHGNLKSTLSYHSKKYKNKTYYYMSNQPYTENYEEEFHWLDTLNNIDSVLYIREAYSWASDQDTVYRTGVLKESKEVGTWTSYTQKGIIDKKKYPPYEYRNDTITIVYNDDRSIYSIQTLDTLSNILLSVTFPNNSVLVDSVYSNRNNNVSDILSKRSYYANGNLFVDKNESQFNVYYPSGVLASNDVKFNTHAENGRMDKRYLFRFDYPLSVYGEGNAVDGKVNLVRPRIKLDSTHTYFYGSPGTRYLLIKSSDNYHSYDKTTRKIVKYDMEFEASFAGPKWLSVSPTNNPAIWKSLSKEAVSEYGMENHLKPDLFSSEVDNAWCINEEGNRLATLISVQEDNNNAISIQLKILNLVSGKVETILSLDTAGHKMLAPEEQIIEFLDNESVYLSMFNHKNVFSLKEKKFITKVNYKLDIEKVKYVSHSHWNSDLLMTVDTSVFQLVHKSGKIEEIRFDGKGPHNITDYKWYPNEQKLFFSSGPSMIQFDNKLKKLDTLVNSFRHVLKWGKRPDKIELITYNKGFQVLHLAEQNEEQLLNNLILADSINVLPNKLIVKSNSIVFNVSIYGLSEISNDELEKIPMEVAWEASFINKKYITETSIHHSNDNKYIYTPKYADGVFFWNSMKNRRIEQHVELILLPNANYLFHTPDKYYMISDNRDIAVHFEKELKIYPFEQFDIKYNRPDIILDRLGYADSTLVQAYHKAYQKRLKKMGFTEDMLKEDFHLPEIKIENFEYMPSITDSISLGLNLQLNDTKYKLDRINIWVNDVAVYGSNGISLRSKDVSEYKSKIDINLVKGDNKIQVSVLNQAGAESYKETVEIKSTAGKAKPDLYLIAIGESEFEDSNYNLTYAAKDAEDIATLFSKSVAYHQVFTKTLTNKQVTKDNIEALRNFISQADINDEVMVFIAGHGVLDQELDYFFATYDMDFNNPGENGLAYEDLEGLLDGIKPLKKTLLIDACHSGEIDKEEVELLAQNTTQTGGVQFRAVGNTVTQKLGIQNTSELTKSLFTDLRKGTGATVISSAGGMEFAMEGDDWNNGLFTYCLINGIQSKEADLNKDGEIWLSELKQYVSEKVTKLSNGKQQPTSRIENQVLDYRIW